MKSIFLLLSIFSFQIAFSQEITMRPLNELINKEDPGWAVVEDWMKEAKNKIEVLEKDPAKADSALYQTQVTTRSPMGAIIYETGGILVDYAWIRILGSGSDKMQRSLPEWNKGKYPEEYGERAPYILIADDAIGGFFALNGGALGDDFGKVYYLAPETLEWEPLDVGYSGFIQWTFNGDLEDFYKGLRWKRWKREVREMGPDRVIQFYPYLFTKYKKLELLSRQDIPIEEMWHFQMDLLQQLTKTREK